jgi:hypothetical protein
MLFHSPLPICCVIPRLRLRVKKDSPVNGTSVSIAVLMSGS